MKMVETPKATAINWNSGIVNQPINPFEENNRFRLEQSILSPNLFNATSLLTPEKDTSNSIWNIDQRAILFPADIPTDEKLLIAQYLHDSKLSRQVSAAVETFWSQNKTVIESPAPSSTSSLYKEKIKTTKTSTITKNSNEMFQFSNEVQETTFINKNTKDQTCQTVLSFPFDLDINKISALKKFLNEPVSNINKNKKQSASSPSLRKQLFSQYESDDDHKQQHHKQKQYQQNQHSPSISPNSLDSIDWNEAKYQERFSSSPKFKFININDLDVCSTPELSPHKINDEKQLFKFDIEGTGNHNNNNNNNNNSHVEIEIEDQNNNNKSSCCFNVDSTQTINNYLDLKLNKTTNSNKNRHNHLDILINSPNLSPIKELSLLIAEDNNNNNSNKINESINNKINKKKQQQQSFVIDMDIDIGGILKASKIQQQQQSTNDSSKNIDNFSFITNAGDQNNSISCRKYTRELSSEIFNSQNDLMNTSRPFTVTNVFEITSNNTQDQDTGYQTNGSTQFCNMMDLTNNNTNNNNNNNNNQLQESTTTIQKTQQHEQQIENTKLKHPSSLNLSYKRVNSFSKETPTTLNLPSFAGLCPLGSSTPEKAKPYFHLNDSYNNDTDYLSVTNGLNTNTLYKPNSTFSSSIKHALNKDLLKTSAAELDSSYMEQSLLQSKLSPSEYARTLIQRAMQDLDESKDIKL